MFENFWDIHMLKNAKYDLEQMSATVTRMIDNSSRNADKYNDMSQEMKWVGQSYNNFEYTYEDVFYNDAVHYRDKIDNVIERINDKITELKEE